MARRSGLARTRGSVWADHGLKPWKVDTFKVSNDPYFEEKLVDVVGCCSIRRRGVVFSYDEKTQCQALDRTQPSLPLTPGGRHMTHTTSATHHRPVRRDEHRNRPVLTDCQKAHAAPTCCASSNRSTRRAASTAIHVCWTICRRTAAPRLPSARAQKPPPLAPTLHAHVELLAEPDRTLVQRTHRQATAPRRSPVSPSSPSHHHLSRALERQPQAIHLESDRRRDHRQVQRGREKSTDQIKRLALEQAEQSQRNRHADQQYTQCIRCGSSAVAGFRASRNSGGSPQCVAGKPRSPRWSPPTAQR